MDADRPNVLIVEQSHGVRERIAGWLEHAGFQVMSCPGPTAPDYTCVAGRTGHCPLAHGADLVVVDLWLEGDSMMEGTSAVELLAYYVSTGLPIIALSHGYEAAHLFMEENLVDLPWPPERRDLLETAHLLAGKSAPPGR